MLSINCFQILTNLNFLDIFLKNFCIKLHVVHAGGFVPCRWTDITMIVVAFQNFVKIKNVKI